MNNSLSGQTQERLSPSLANEPADTSDLSITDALAVHGYSSRPSTIDGKRLVFKTATGAIMGAMDAQDAAFFIAGLEERS